MTTRHPGLYAQLRARNPYCSNDQPDRRLSLGSRMSARATGKRAPHKGRILASFAQRSRTSSNNRHFKQFLSESGEVKLCLRHDLAEQRKVLAENVLGRVEQLLSKFLPDEESSDSQNGAYEFLLQAWDAVLPCRSTHCHRPWWQPIMSTSAPELYCLAGTCPRQLQKCTACSWPALGHPARQYISGAEWPSAGQAVQFWSWRGHYRLPPGPLTACIFHLPCVAEQD